MKALIGCLVFVLVCSLGSTAAALDAADTTIEWTAISSQAAVCAGGACRLPVVGMPVFKKIIKKTVRPAGRVVKATVRVIRKAKPLRRVIKRLAKGRQRRVARRRSRR